MCSSGEDITLTVNCERIEKYPSGKYMKIIKSKRMIFVGTKRENPVLSPIENHPFFGELNKKRPMNSAFASNGNDRKR